MATGVLTPDGMAVLEIELSGQLLPAVIDTGFEGGLQLPHSWYPRLQPPPYRQVTYQLGGGQILVQHTYLVTFALDGHTQTVETLFADSDEILLGVDAMREYRLVIDFPANSVTLERPAVP